MSWLETVDYSNLDLLQLPKELQQQQLKTLILNNNLSINLNNINFYQSLRVLYADGCQLDQNQIDILYCLSNLEKLSVRENNLISLRLPILPKLEFLDASNNNLSEISGIQQLSHLSFGSADQITANSLDFLFQMVKCQCLVVAEKPRTILNPAGLTFLLQKQRQFSRIKAQKLSSQFKTENLRLRFGTLTTNHQIQVCRECLLSLSKLDQFHFTSQDFQGELVKLVSKSARTNQLQEQFAQQQQFGINYLVLVIEVGENAVLYLLSKDLEVVGFYQERARIQRTVGTTQLSLIGELMTGKQAVFGEESKKTIQLVSNRRQIEFSRPVLTNEKVELKFRKATEKEFSKVYSTVFDEDEITQLIFGIQQKYHKTDIDCKAAFFQAMIDFQWLPTNVIQGQTTFSISLPIQLQTCVVPFELELNLLTSCQDNSFFVHPQLVNHFLIAETNLESQLLITFSDKVISNQIPSSVKLIPTNDCLKCLVFDQNEIELLDSKFFSLQYGFSRNDVEIQHSSSNTMKFDQCNKSGVYQGSVVVKYLSTNKEEVIKSEIIEISNINPQKSVESFSLLPNKVVTSKVEHVEQIIIADRFSSSQPLDELRQQRVITSYIKTPQQQSDNKSKFLIKQFYDNQDVDPVVAVDSKVKISQVLPLTYESLRTKKQTITPNHFPKMNLIPLQVQLPQNSNESTKATKLRLKYRSEVEHFNEQNQQIVSKQNTINKDQQVQKSITTDQLNQQQNAIQLDNCNFQVDNIFSTMQTQNTSKSSQTLQNNNMQDIQIPSTSDVSDFQRSSSHSTSNIPELATESLYETQSSYAEEVIQVKFISVSNQIEKPFHVEFKAVTSEVTGTPVVFVLCKWKNDSFTIHDTKLNLEYQGNKEYSVQFSYSDACVGSIPYIYIQYDRSSIFKLQKLVHKPLISNWLKLQKVVVFRGTCCAHKLAQFYKADLAIGPMSQIWILADKYMEEDELAFESASISAIIPNRFVMHPYTTYVRQTGNEVLLQNLHQYYILKNNFEELMEFNRENSFQRQIYTQEVEQDLKQLTKNYQTETTLVITIGGYIVVFHFRNQFERDHCYFLINFNSGLTFFDLQMEYIRDGQFDDLFNLQFSNELFKKKRFQFDLVDDTIDYAVGKKLNIKFNGRGFLRAEGYIQNRETVYYQQLLTYDMEIPPCFYNHKLELIMYNDNDISIVTLTTFVTSQTKFDHINSIQLKYISELNDSEGVVVKFDSERFRLSGKLIDPVKEDIMDVLIEYVGKYLVITILDRMFVFDDLPQFFLQLVDAITRCQKQ